MTLCWILTSTHKHHIMSIQYPSHKCLPEKSYLDCLRILIMPWLYNNPIVIMPYCLRTVAWLSFGHVQSKGNQQPKKIKLPKLKFFSRKSTNKIFLYLLAHFILQNLKKIPRIDPEFWECAIFWAKTAYLSWTKYFWYKPLLSLSSTFWPFSLRKI